MSIQLLKRSKCEEILQLHPNAIVQFFLFEIDPLACVLLCKTSGSAVVRSLTQSAASANFRAILSTQISDIREAGTYKNERIITSSQSTSISVQGSHGKILNFCANNYLGLSVRYHWEKTN